MSTIGGIIGLTMLLSGIQFYMDLQTAQGLEEERKSDFLVINKQISEAVTFGFGDPTFNQEDIQELHDQDFVLDVSPILSTDFTSWVEVHLNKAQDDVKTLISFVSIPEKFLANIPEEFHWSEGDKVIPVILSTSLIDTYNLIASASGWPAMSKTFLQNVQGTVQMTGPIGEMHYYIKIVGYTDRYSNAVIAPDNFVKHHNTVLAGSASDKPPSQMVISTRNSRDPVVKAFLDDHQYETNTERLSAKDVASVYEPLMSALLGIGIIMVILTLSNMLLLSQLSMHRHSEEVALLLFLGYTHNVLAKVYTRYFSRMVLVTTVVAVGLSMGFKYFTNGLFATYLSTELSMLPSLWYIITAVLFAALSILWIRANVRIHLNDVK